MANKFKKRPKLFSVNSAFYDTRYPFEHDIYKAEDIKIKYPNGDWMPVVESINPNAKPLATLIEGENYQDENGVWRRTPDTYRGNINYLKYHSKYGPMKSKKSLTSLKERQRAVFNKALSEGKSRKEAWKLCQRAGGRKGQW